MRQPITFLAAAAAALLIVSGAAAGDFNDATIEDVKHPAWFKESFFNLPDDLEEARKAGKQGLLLFFSTQGCSYCHLFIAKSLGDPVIEELLRAHFDTIGMEIFDDAEMTDFQGKTMRVKEFALREGAEFAPTLLFYDTSGKLVLRLSGYYEPARFDRALNYLVGRHYEQVPFRNWLARQEPSERGVVHPKGLIPDPLFAHPPFALDRTRVKAQRPLVVLFESADCPSCERFHAEVLSDSQVREKLRGFDVVRLDAGDSSTAVLTPGGRRTAPAAWMRTLGFTQLPALAFFDEGGVEVLQTDALVLKNRMMNSLGFVTERAYEKGWTYQRFARSQSIAKAAVKTDAAETRP
jgi:thioredoxin-related protein